MTDLVPQRVEEPTAYLIPRSAPPREDEGKRRDFWSVVRRHMGLVLGCLTVVLIVAAIVTVIMRPTYDAIASVRIDEKPANLPAMDVLNELATSDVSTEMQVLQSRSLAQQVTDSLGLQLRLAEPKRMLPSFKGAAAYRLQRSPDGRFVLIDRMAEKSLGTYKTGDSITIKDVSLVF